MPASSSGTYLTVGRMNGSESCPDADAVFRSIALLFPERAVQRVYDLRRADTNVQVMVRPLGAGHEAHIKLFHPRSGERVITEPDPNCRGLAEALAVALTMLVDPQSEHAARSPAAANAQPAPAGAPHAPNGETTSTETPATTTVAPAPPPPQQRPTATQSDRGRRKRPVPAPKKRTLAVAALNQPQTGTDRAALQPVAAVPPGATIWSTHVRMGALVGYRLLSKPELGLALGADFYHSSGLGLELDALGTWLSPAENLGGSIRHRRIGGLLGACYAGAAWARAEYQLCLEFGAGAVSTKTESFAVIYEADRLDWWVMTGPKLGYLHELSGGVGVVVSVAGLANLTRDRYLVENSGPLTQSQPFGIMSLIGIRLSGPMLHSSR